MCVLAPRRCVGVCVGRVSPPEQAGGVVGVHPHHRAVLQTAGHHQRQCPGAGLLQRYRSWASLCPFSFSIGCQLRHSHLSYAHWPISKLVGGTSCLFLSYIPCLHVPSYWMLCLSFLCLSFLLTSLERRVFLSFYFSSYILVFTILLDAVSVVLASVILIDCRLVGAGLPVFSLTLLVFSSSFD